MRQLDECFGDNAPGVRLCPSAPSPACAGASLRDREGSICVFRAFASAHRWKKISLAWDVIIRPNPGGILCEIYFFFSPAPVQNVQLPVEGDARSFPIRLP